LAEAVIVFLAAPRKAPNIHTTLLSMYLADPSAVGKRVVVLWDSPDAREFSPYRGYSSLRVLWLSEREADERKGWTLQQRTCAQMRRAIENLGEDGGLVCEDDLAFSLGWVNALSVGVGGPDPVLCYNREEPGVRVHPPDKELNACCMIWYPPGCLARKIADSFAQCDTSMDQWIGRWCKANGVPIRILPIVQHVGDIGGSICNPTHGKRHSLEWQQKHGDLFA
jgi:hypothetical protein